MNKRETGGHELNEFRPDAGSRSHFRLVFFLLWFSLLSLFLLVLRLVGPPWIGYKYYHDEAFRNQVASLIAKIKSYLPKVSLPLSLFSPYCRIHSFVLFWDLVSGKDRASPQLPLPVLLLLSLPRLLPLLLLLKSTHPLTIFSVIFFDSSRIVRQDG